MKELFQVYLHNSIGLSVVSSLILALTPLLSRRYSAKCRYTLYLIVMFAFIIPIHPQIQIHMPKTIQPLVPEHALNLFNAINENGMPAANEKAYDLWQTAALLWAGGALCFLLRYSFHHLRFMSAVRRWSEEISPDKKEWFQVVKNEMGINRKIAIRSCACIQTPMMVGFLKPVILFPEIDLTADEFSFVLRHELVHYRRKDLYCKLLVMLALAIHWFNPVAHIMARSVLDLCEISCDEEVLRRADRQIRAHYGETIICVIRKGNFRQTAFSTNFYSGRKVMKKRIDAIMDMKRKRFSLLALFVAAILTFCGISAIAMTSRSSSDQIKSMITSSSNPSLKTGGSSVFSDSENTNRSDGIVLHGDSAASVDSSRSPQLVAIEQTNAAVSSVTSGKTDARSTPH